MASARVATTIHEATCQSSSSNSHEKVRRSKTSKKKRRRGTKSIKREADTVSLLSDEFVLLS